MHVNVRTALLVFALSCCKVYAQGDAFPPIGGGGGGVSAKSCVGTPGNTTGQYLQQCQTAAGAIWACNNSSGCALAADWVRVPASGALACADLSNAAASCSTDATNASNIASGTLNFARLPVGLSIMTTLGDVMYGGASGALTRLAGDTSNTRKFFRALSVAGVATAPVWDTLLSGDIPNNAANTSGTAGGLSGTSLGGDVTNSGNTVTFLTTVNPSPGSCGDATHVCQVNPNNKGLTTSANSVAITFPTGGSFQAVQTFSTSATSAVVTYGITIGNPQAVTSACYVGTAGSATQITITSFAYTNTTATLGFAPAASNGWCVANFAGTLRTYYYTFQGNVQSTATGYALNTPGGGTGALAPNFINVGGTVPMAIAQWPCYTGGGCSGAYASIPYAWGTFILPASYPSNSPISYSVESTCDTATTCDSALNNRLILGLACSGVSSPLNNPTFTDASQASGSTNGITNITNNASGNQTITPGSLTPNANSMPSCSAGNRVWIRIKVDTNTNSNTGPFDLASITFSLQAGN